MSNNKSFIRGHHAHTPAFRLKPLSALIALSVFAAAPLHAADDKQFAGLQLEVARLKQALAQAQQELAAAKPPPDGAEPVAAGALAAAPEGKEEEPTKLGEVTVRGRNRIALLQNVPVSVSVVSGKELEREGAADLDTITKRAANVS